MSKFKKLSPRLRTVADLARGDILADIGSDHAYLPVWLVQNSKIKKAYAVDISEKCVERIKKNLARFNIPHTVIMPVLSDGLSSFENIPDKPTDIVIAGMGGETIAEIINGAGIEEYTDVHFILQPNTKKEKLKDFLSANNFKILREITVREKRRVYTVISAEIKM